MKSRRHGPSDAMHNPPQPLKVRKTLISKLTEITLIPIDFLTSKHLSDTEVFTMKMEILLEPTSNKLMVDAPVWRTASTTAKPCQGDSFEFYLITGIIYTDIMGNRWWNYRRHSGEIGVKGTLKKSFLPPRWRLLMAQIIQCLGGKTGGHDQISNKDAIILYCLANRVKVDYAKLVWEDIIHKLKKKTREKVVPYPSVLNWALKPNQHEGPPFTDHMKSICNIDVHVDSQALKTSSQTEKVPQGKKRRANSGLRRKQSSKHTSKSQTEVSKSKIGQSDKETQSSSAKDKSPSHTSPSTPVVGEMHKEAQQAAVGPTSLGATRSDVSLNSTAKADPGILLLMNPHLNNKSEEEEIEKDKDTQTTSHDVPNDTSVPHPPSPKSAQIQELMAQVHLLQSQKEKLEQQKAKPEAEVASLKARPSYLDINQLTELLVVELKNIQWELPAEFLDLPSQVSSVQEKLKTLDSLLSLLNKVTDTLNRFATMVETASGAASKNVPSASQAIASPAEEEKNTNLATRDVEPTNLHNELVDLLGIDIMT
ncbi:hypothetical protein Tco_0390237 [Tanacetum coccineum]|uniref:Uncharacterized protein n=1 Tax=Tanacetum coccineum TaxID=301880 RepID=A0ABQ4XP43_9ASTR